MRKQTILRNLWEDPTKSEAEQKAYAFVGVRVPTPQHAASTCSRLSKVKDHHENKPGFKNSL